MCERYIWEQDVFKDLAVRLYLFDRAYAFAYFQPLLEMPRKLKYDQHLYTRRHWEYGHTISAVLDLVGFGALTASVLIDNKEARANG